MIESEYDAKYDWVEIYRDGRKVVTLDFFELEEITEKARIEHIKRNNEEMKKERVADCQVECYRTKWDKQEYGTTTPLDPRVADKVKELVDKEMEKLGWF